MKSPRVLPSLLGVLCACQGAIADPVTSYDAHELQAVHDDGAASAVHPAAGSGADLMRVAARPPVASAADGGGGWRVPTQDTEDAGTSPPTRTEVSQPRADDKALHVGAGDTHQPIDGPATVDAGTSAPPHTEASAPHTDMALRVGAGDLQQPVDGPAPVDAAKLGGSAFKLVKNWDFGTDGTIKNQQDLDAEFQYHDQFGTIANGTNYGSVTVAAEGSSAIQQSGLGLPNDRQPVEDPARPTREFTTSSLLAHVRPLSNSQSTVSASRHDAGNGSFTAKWSLPNGGELLGHDVVWETRARMPTPVPGYWFALWNAGKLWDKGAEMDVLESFGTPNIAADAFHSDSVGGSNTVNYNSWPNGLDSAGVPSNDRELHDWHTWTWIYRHDDSYEVYYDGYQVQHGSIHWTHGATPDGEPIDLWFLFDFAWGHTQVSDVDIEVPASQFPLTYEIDYSRVYMR